MTAPALQIHALGKIFGGQVVLDHIDLELAAGSIAAVVGPSGCGKTTLLRLIAGFECPDSGTIAIGGRTVAADPTAHTPPHRRRVGYVAQDGALFPHLTVEKNIAYGLRRTVRGSALKARVGELLDMVSLDATIGERQPHELSGGQQQRVALARALARQPDVMLLDEPFSSLDTGLRSVTRKSVVTMLSDAGVSALLVTHDQEEALSTAGQVAVMNEGRFTQVGTPSQVYQSPVDPFTARFLGDCVFLPAHVDTTYAHCALGAVPVHKSRIHGAATIMVRPEQLTATVATPRESDGTGTVVSSEYLGADVDLMVTLPELASPIAVRQNSIDAPPVGAAVHVRVLGSAVVFSRMP